MKDLLITPRQMLLIDSIGAMISALLLGGILVTFEPFFGMPATILYPLAGVALIFAIYSQLTYKAQLKDHAPFLRGIAIANMLYCCVTAGLVIAYLDALTIWGIGYFVIEIVLVVGLAIFELKTAAK